MSVKVHRFNFDSNFNVSSPREYVTKSDHDAEIAKLEARCKELQEDSRNAQNHIRDLEVNTIMNLELENQKLQSALDVAVEALGSTWPNMFPEIRQHHNEALDKIKQIKGE